VSCIDLNVRMLWRLTIFNNWSTKIYAYLYFFDIQFDVIKSNLLLLFSFWSLEILLKSTSISVIYHHSYFIVFYIWVSNHNMDCVTLLYQLVRIPIKPHRNCETYYKYTFYWLPNRKMIFQRLVNYSPLVTLYGYYIFCDM